MSQQPERLSCQKCKFFYVTWDRSFPYGCKAMGFKGKTMPYLMVFQASGKPCMAYEENEPASKQES